MGNAKKYVGTWKQSCREAVSYICYISVFSQRHKNFRYPNISQGGNELVKLSALADVQRRYEAEEP
jgi:hypothetical protein